MKLLIHGKNIEITDSIREYVTQKIEKSVNHFQDLTLEVDVHLSVAKNPRNNSKQTAEVTIFANKMVIRAEESSENLYASIDLVSDKIARQLRKYKEKRLSKKSSSVRTPATEVIEQQPIIDDLIGNRSPELPKEVVRTKYFVMTPMTVEEALEQLQLVDHDFYMFRNADTGDINVIYERNHGGYGVLQPRENGNSVNGSPSLSSSADKAYAKNT
jgi:putative sigma-54 modulation protein